MNKNIWVIVGVVVLVVAGWFVFKMNYANGPTTGEEVEDLNEDAGDETSNSEEEDSDEGASEDDGAAGTVPSGEPIITYTDEGFSPSELTVAAGTEVTFVNNSSSDLWPASAVHPTHTVYPGSNISKCGTEEASTIFDACVGIAPGGTYKFTFNEVGEWGYHNHLKVSEFGRIIVLAD